MSNGVEQDLSETSPGEASEPAAGAAHDAPTNDVLANVMAANWMDASTELPDADEVAAHTALRRTALAAAFPGDTLVVPTGNLKVRANDTDYPFRPGSDFFWLTGSHEPDAVVIISNEDATLYLPDRSDRSTPEFYRDRRYGELWVGPRHGVREVSALLGIDCEPIEHLDAALSALDPSTTRIVRDFDDAVDRQFERNDRDQELAAKVSELRLIKDDYEIARLRHAMSATAEGFEECVRELGHARAAARGERWIEGTFWRRARTEGNDVGYPSIVACGHHATTLHWIHNNGPVRNGDLALLDMGIESDALYTADITRTIPINGIFSPAQRKVYDAVLRAQRAALEAVRPGASFLDPHRTAMKVLAQDLEAWGILPVPADEALREGNGHYRRYTLHGVSHMLGLDVHDCSQARDELYYAGTLQPGMVLTVEPGLYFQLDDLTVPEELRGIGVRIEDDVLVTATGYEVLSNALPTDADDVERWMARLTT